MMNLLLLIFLSLALPLGAQRAAAPQAGIIEVPVSHAGAPATAKRTTMAILLSGDGGWAAGDRALAAALADRNIPVVGWDMRRYLSRTREPEEASADLAQLLTNYSDAWNRQTVLLIGYSRGADIAPFLINRLPDSLRSRIVRVALFGPGERANFRVYWSDVIVTKDRPTDRFTRPELERLRGIPIMCIAGAKDSSCICNSLDASFATLHLRRGGHVLGAGEGEPLARLIAEGLP